MKEIKGGITAVKGIAASGIHCGIKKSKADLALIVSENPAAAAGVFTTNKVKAAPVLVSMEHVMQEKTKAIIANSGSANACTGEAGLKDAKEMVRLVAKELKTSPKSILIASTGAIGKPLPMEKIKKGIPVLVKELDQDGGKRAAEAIMTTDTFSKETAVEYVDSGKAIRIGGMVKGAGMICPHMATMLSFIASDVVITKELLQKALKKSADRSFNMITIDGDQSTNDTVICLANGMAGNRMIDKPGKGLQLFQEALDLVAKNLAKMIVQDGEGATRFLEIKVKNAKSFQDAKKVAFSIANSNLVKTAFFGEEFNWGRIIAAAGSSGVDLDFSSMSLFFGDIQVIKKGKILYLSENPDIQKVLKAKGIKIILDIGRGKKEAVVWTTDLSYEYVRINAEYIS
jgi:glutamate N-acetyltransferase/amino-acid N-acetyltransferase